MLMPFIKNIIFYPSSLRMSTRAILSFFISLVFSLSIGFFLIKFFRKLNFNQVIRHNGPKSHLCKNHTPTMGGIIILFSIFFTIIICADLSNLYIWCVIFILLGYGTIGFIDDYKKIIKKNTKGLTPKWKYILQSILAIITSFIIYKIDIKTFRHIEIFTPIIHNIQLEFGILYFIIMYFFIVGTSNAVNLTDGLDGLVIVPIIIISTAFTFFSWVSSDVQFSFYFNMPYIKNAHQLIIVSISIIGSGLGFLWFNTYPAKIFMGDVGSLPLGAILGTIAILLHQELLFIIMGGMFVIVTLSVIFQIVSFKFLKKRIFLMAPIHHHYELKGHPEPRIIIRFWILSLIFMIISLSLLKIT